MRVEDAAPHYPIILDVPLCLDARAAGSDGAFCCILVYSFLSKSGLSEYVNLLLVTAADGDIFAANQLQRIEVEARSASLLRK
jgi:hypothetical protein